MIYIDNENEYTEEDLLNIAKKRIRIKRNLISHISSYVVVNAFLIFIYYVTGDHEPNEVPWYIWTLAGWGIFIVLDIINTIQSLRLTFNTNAINKELEKIKRTINKK
ncbi:MAG TPA: 2TM domain-containing protein [Haloplasmataceae bacterium]